jgi:hypothetical protein
MDARRDSEPTPTKNPTTVERKSEREIVVTRTFNGPARIVFEAWTKPELTTHEELPPDRMRAATSNLLDALDGVLGREDFADLLAWAVRVFVTKNADGTR